MQLQHDLIRILPISSSKEALMHLLLSCCNADGECSDAELQTVFSLMYSLYDVDETWLKENADLFQLFTTRTMHYPSYLQYLLRKIDTSDPETLLRYCAQVIVADGELSFPEELLIERIGRLLHIDTQQILSIHRHAWQTQVKSNRIQHGHVGSRI